MSARCYKGRWRRPVPTTLGKAPPSGESDTVDLSHLRRPMETSVYGLSQVLKLFETATEEVRQYISYECDIIYECRACRTLFRSLGNFVLHKRAYCHEIFELRDLQASDGEISYNGDVSGAKHVQSNNSSPSDPKKIDTVLRRLSETRRHLKISNEIATSELNGAPVKQEPAEGGKLCLETIDATPNGVYQTTPAALVGDELMKSEVMEIHSILDGNEAILGADGKHFVFGAESIARRSKAVEKKLRCPICDLKFSTKKTLTFHVKYKHNETRLVYVCPECKDTFSNAWCVFRHLYKVHRKNTAQIRRLRDYVHSSAIARSQDTKGCKRERSERENQHTSPTFLDADQSCSGCGKRFERKAALNSHLQLCTKRLSTSSSAKSEERSTTDEKSSSEKDKSPKQRAPIRGAEKRKPQLIKTYKRKQSPTVILRSDDEDTLGFENDQGNLSVANNTETIADNSSEINNSLQIIANNCLLETDKNNLLEREQKKSEDEPQMDVGQRRPKRRVILSLRARSQAYLNWEGRRCVPCDLTFVSHHYLMKHMAQHFGWRRFRCESCTFSCYDKMACVRHVQSQHRIDQSIVDNFVVAMETSESAAKATDFTPVDVEKCRTESKQGLVKPKEPQELTKGGNDDREMEKEEMRKEKMGKDEMRNEEMGKTEKELDKRDPMVRQMIMEVIFGSDVQQVNNQSANVANTRPVRQKTSVRELKTDFLFDMTETDVEMPVSVSPNDRVKPIKIIKNADFDFQVIKDTQSPCKKRKS